MKPTNKAHFLDRLESRVEQHIMEAVSHFQNLPEPVLLEPAKDGGWSIAQCLDHLNGYGDYYLPQIKKGLDNAKSYPFKSTFKSSWLGSYFTRMMEPETGKKKMKAFKNHIPSPHPDAYAVVATFIQQQEALLQYLKQAGRADLNKIRIPVSIAKFVKLNLGDVFQFLIAHNERHIRQAKRNIPEKVSNFQLS
ncbi:MAG: DinB family protein [Sphingobacteriales bacterium]|mgnify:FL=1|nr:DinB family protein [Sphingobacteriales bacterium]OJY91867.1 MAG: hypothetical protein BGP14_23340 [Sphingobacteriales bacterium 44-15]